MRFNRFLHLIAFAGKAHRGSPASGGLTTKMPDGGAPSQAMSQPDFSPYLPLSGVGAGLDLYRGDSTNVVDQDCGEVPRRGTVKAGND